MSNGEPGYDAAVTGPNSSQEASGSSIFWAMTAIVLNAMLQPSFCGYIWSGDSFEGLVWPHRSSPVICLLDAIAESWIVVERYKNPTRDPDETAAPARSTDVALRLTIFALAVLPQAIKLFSMRGIPATQVLAAVFFASTLISMLRSTCIEAPHKGLARLVESLRGSNKEAHVGLVTTVLAWFLHGLGLLGVWHVISAEIRVPASQNTRTGVARVSLFTALFGLVYILQHMIFMLLNKRSPIAHFSVVILVLGQTNNLGLSELFQEPEARRKWETQRWTFALYLLVDITLGSYGLACLLEKLAKYLITTTQVTGSQDDSALELARSSSTSHEPGIASEARDRVQQAGASIDAGTRAGSDGDLPALEVLRVEMMTPSTVTQPGQIGDVNESAAGSNMETRETSLTSETSDDNLLSLYITKFINSVWVYGGLLQLGKKEDQESAHQSAAERGIVQPSAEVAESPEPGLSIAQKLWILVNWPCVKLVRYTYLLIWRFGQAYWDIYTLSLRSIYHYIVRQPNEPLVIAFGITNFATAIIYYIQHFDGTGTFAPNWTTVLG
jgi:hypothetical protein